MHGTRGTFHLLARRSYVHPAIDLTCVTSSTTVRMMFFSRLVQVKGTSVVFKLFDVAGHDKVADTDRII